MVSSVHIREALSDIWHQFGITMPINNTEISIPASKFYESISYETLTASWLTRHAWEVFSPMIDHGMKTDLLISNGKMFYRIQVKTVESNDENQIVDNKWGSVDIDYVIYFSLSEDWGYITRPFEGKRKRLNSPDHIRFHQHPNNFIKAFKKI